jgi:hypothetical protein
MIQTWKKREEKEEEPTFTLSALWNEEQKKSSQEREREKERKWYDVTYSNAGTGFLA